MPKSLTITAPGELAALLQLSALDAEIRQAESRAAHLADAVDAARHRAGIREATSARERILATLDPRLAERYRGLIQQGSAAFVVPVRDGRCAGCVARLSLALLDGLCQPDAVGICPRCQRMVYDRAPHA